MASRNDIGALTPRRAVGVAVGAALIGAAVAFPATAVAEPVPLPPPAPVDPAAPPPPGPAVPPPPPGPTVPVLGQPLTNGLGVLGQTGQPGVPGALGAPEMAGLDRSSVLGLNPTPLPPGAGPGVVPNLNVFNNAYGLPQNEVPAAPGQGQQFDVAPGQENADVGKREWLGRYVDLYRDGRLKGGFLGQMPKEQLGQPLPGTAPPPGTVISPGLVQNLPPAPVDGTPPPPPGLILSPPPPPPAG